MVNNSQHFANGYNRNCDSHSISYSRLPFSLNSSTMALLADINVVSKTLPALTKLSNIQRIPNRVKIVGFLCKKKEDFQEHPLQTTRRLAIGLASIALIGDSTKGISLAKENWFWREGPLTVPPVYNSKLSHKKLSIYNVHFTQCCFIRKCLNCFSICLFHNCSFSYRDCKWEDGYSFFSENWTLYGKYRSQG